MADSVNYQHFKLLKVAYEKAFPEKSPNANAVQIAVNKVWKNMKENYSRVEDLAGEVKRQINEWKTLSFTKKSMGINL